MGYALHQSWFGPGFALICGRLLADLVSSRVLVGPVFAPDFVGGFCPILTHRMS